MAEGQGQPAGPERCRVGRGGAERNQPAGDHMGGHQEAHHREVLRERKRGFLTSKEPVGMLFVYI